MWVGAASGIGLSPATATSDTYNATTNHKTNEVYDAAGNQTTMGGIYSFSYDAENRQISETNSIGNPAAQYAYDGDGHRVQKTVGGNTTVYVYDALGQLAAEYTNTPGGTPPCQTCYLTYDHLGSTRMVTDENAHVVSLHDYLPFGEEIPGNSVGRSGLFGPGTDQVNQKFTGKERDQESGLDYFGARYYGSNMGRWMSPDPSNLGVDIYMLETWNRYNYAANNPLTIKDANGLWPFYIHNEIIGESFPGMSKQDLQGLKDASWNMDFGKGQQDPAKSYEHGMSDGTTNQDPMVAQQMGDNYVSQQVQTAQQAQADWEAQGHTGIAPGALTAFGNALHTATDRTSPSHQGNQPWHNDPWYNKRTRTHVEGEATINAAQRNAARNTAQQLFHRTFGNEFYWILQKAPCFSTSTDDGLGNKGHSGCQ